MASFSYDYEVCVCKKVTLGEIVCAIQEKEANTIEDIGKLTDAGTMCGCCKSKSDDFGNPKMSLYIDQILKKITK